MHVVSCYTQLSDYTRLFPAGFLTRCFDSFIYQTMVVHQVFMTMIDENRTTQRAMVTDHMFHSAFQEIHHLGARFRDYYHRRRC